MDDFGNSVRMLRFKYSFLCRLASQVLRLLSLLMSMEFSIPGRSGLSALNRIEIVDDIETGTADPQSDLATAKKTVLSVYNEVWNEFYAWEQDDCSTAINSLAREHTCRPPALPLASLPHTIHVISHSTSTNTFTPGAQFVATCLNIIVEQPLEPHPKYQSCAPSQYCFMPRPDDPIFLTPRVCTSYHMVTSSQTNMLSSSTHLIHWHGKT